MERLAICRQESKVTQAFDGFRLKERMSWLNMAGTCFLAREMGRKLSFIYWVLRSFVYILPSVHLYAFSIFKAGIIMLHLGSDRWFLQGYMWIEKQF